MNPIPNGPFKVILADCPWFYKDRRNTHTKFSGGARKHYPLMRTSDICSIPISSIADKDCLLFLWATFPCLPDALEVMKSWGFRYSTVAFSWLKTNRRNGKPFFGIGYWTKSNTEICLLGIKGKPIKVSNSVSQVVISPRMGHSCKPDEVRNRIVDLCGDVPRIELFSREICLGWSGWGLDYPG